MHWSEEIARKIIARKPNKKEYVCAAGISPSGSVHIGNFRDIATSYFVYRALIKAGKKARLLFSWDELDRLRKIPVNVSTVAPDMEKYIGYPYVDVPNPFSDSPEKTYAAYFEKEFEASIKEFGIEMDYRYQGEMYRSGKYAPYIVHALKHRREIFDILIDHRTQEAEEGEREAYYPVSIYCPHCHRDTTVIDWLSEDAERAHYNCKCGYSGYFDFTVDFNCKLAWKTDWPMRWLYEGVDFEPGGKDHASINGSYDTSKEIALKVFGFEPPLFQAYEFIGIRGTTGKMSGSSGLNLTPGTLLKIYQPEVLLWLYAKTEPTKAFDFCFDEGILRQYFEFDKMYNAAKKKDAEDYVKEVMYYALIPGRHLCTVPMNLLVQLGSVVDFNPKMLEIVFEKIGMPYKYEEFRDRLDRARFWLEECSPENTNHLRKTRNREVYDALNKGEREEIKMLFEYLKKGGYTLEELQKELYAIPKLVRGITEDDPELRKLQGEYFKNVYRLLIDKEKGPRLYLFLYAIDPESYLFLLDFDAPPTEEEKDLCKEINSVITETKVMEKPDPTIPFKEEITIEDFQKIDLRVCRVTKCREIKKSANCFCLTLDDGIGERTIVSSIRREYKPEDLIGKKIIVAVNLKPIKIMGVTSEGMLLAGTNRACGCKIVFVSDDIPEGTEIK